MNDNIWHLASKRLADVLTAEEAREWDLWLAQSPENAAWWKEMEKIWRLSDETAQATAFDSQRDWPGLQARMKQGMAAPEARLIRPVWGQRWMQIAAGIIFLFLLGAGLFYSGVFAPATLEMATTPTGQESLTLAEGTKIFLNGDTRLRYPESFGGKERAVYLDTGEAYFEVARDEQHPFVVRTRELAIEVLGTAFNIEHADPLVVSVAHGRVRVRALDQDGPSLILEKGERAIWDSGQATLVRDTVSLNFLAWKTGVLRFRDTPLNVALAEISRFFRTDIHLENADLATQRLTSTFEQESLEVVLETLALNYGLVAEKTGNGYRLR